MPQHDPALACNTSALKGELDDQLPLASSRGQEGLLGDSDRRPAHRMSGPRRNLPHRTASAASASLPAAGEQRALPLVIAGALAAQCVDQPVLAGPDRGLAGVFDHGFIPGRAVRRPQAGTVRIDGHDVRDVTLESLGGHLGMVFQGHLPLPREPCRQPALRASRRERRRRW